MTASRPTSDRSVPTARQAYEAGWTASKRTTTCDLDAAEERFMARHGDEQHAAFVAGWVDYAAGNPKGTGLMTEDERIAAAVAAMDAGDPQPVRDLAAAGILPTDAPIVIEAWTSKETTVTDTLSQSVPFATGFGGSIPDSAIWDDDTRETYGSARVRFSSFGTLLTARQVYMGVPSSASVWSFGYGDDPESFDTVEVTEVEAAVDANGFAATDADWGPFVVYVEVGQEGIGEEEAEPLTMVTIAFTLPSGVQTSVSVDAESVARADALTATLLAAGLSVYREAPRPCADCGQPFEDHGAWSDDLSHTFSS